VPRFKAIGSGKVEVTIEGNWQSVVNSALDVSAIPATVGLRERTEIFQDLGERSKRTTENCGRNFVVKEHEQYAAGLWVRVVSMDKRGRELITLLGGAGVAWPSPVRAAEGDAGDWLPQTVTPVGSVIFW
jgi:hypothetical protein